MASLSTSSTASIFVAVANNLQSEVAMGLVPLSSVAGLFLRPRDVDGKRRENAYDSHLFFCLKKSPACLCRGARQDERQNLSRTDEFQ